MTNISYSLWSGPESAPSFVFSLQRENPKIPTNKTQTNAYVIQVQNLDGEWLDNSVFHTHVWGDAEAVSIASLRVHQHLDPEDAARGITKAPIRRIFRTEVVCPE